MHTKDRLLFIQESLGYIFDSVKQLYWTTYPICSKILIGFISHDKF